MLTSEEKAHLQRLQDEAGDLLAELSDLFPPEYRFTFLARHSDNVEDCDIVLTNDVLDDAIGALDRNKIKMENAS